MLTIILVVLGVLVLCAALEKAPVGEPTRRVLNVVALVCLGLWLLRQAGVV